MTSKVIASAAERNKGPILEVLKNVIGDKFGNSRVNTLEIASGSGQHAVYFSKELRNLEWQPTDIDSICIQSISAYVNECNLPNVKQPLVLDISKEPSEWKLNTEVPYKMMVAINLLHISPWSCCEGLFKAAGQLLEQNGILVTYGPYAINGTITPESNINFNDSLKNRNIEWGLRDIEDLKKVALKNNLTLDAMFNMPANNKTLIWLKN